MKKVYYDYDEVQNDLTKNIRNVWVMIPMSAMGYVYPMSYFMYCKVNN
jgi:hypothetical protein